MPLLELEYLEVLGSIVSFREMSWARIGEFLYKEEAEELLERKVGRTSPLGCRRSYKVDSSALLPFLALSVEMCHLNLNSLHSLFSFWYLAKWQLDSKVLFIAKLYFSLSF